jgi:hypothetical protein
MFNAFVTPDGYTRAARIGSLAGAPDDARQPVLSPHAHAPDLVAVEGKRFIQLSLQTMDPEEARRLNSQKQAGLRERWARMRLRVIVLDDRQIEALSGEAYEKVRDHIGEDRSFWVSHNRASLLWGLMMATDEFPVPENRESSSP